MKKIGLYQAKTELSAIVAAVERSGEGVALTRHGQVVAEIHPPGSRTPKRGCMKTKGFYLADDFNDSETGWEDFWEETSGEMPRRGRKLPQSKSESGT